MVLNMEIQDFLRKELSKKVLKVLSDELDIDYSPILYINKNKYKPKYWLQVLGILETHNLIDETDNLYKYVLTLQKIRKPLLAEKYASFCQRHFDMEVVKDSYLNAISLSNRKEISIHFAKYLVSKGEYKFAEKTYKNLRQEYKSSFNDFDLADIYLNTGRIEAAIHIYKEVISRNESNGQAWKKLRAAENLLRKTDQPDENQIIKSISFKSEHQKAGITILQNFGSLLNEKYPDGGVAFTIKQEGLKVIMVIEHPEGEKETVEDYLNRYGLVVTGRIPPEDFSSDPLMVLDLKRQLIQVESDLKWADEKQLALTSTINKQDNEIERLSNHIKYFQNQLTDVLSNKHIEIKNLLELINRGDIQTESLIQPLIKSINSENIQGTQNALEHIKDNDSSLFQKLNDLVLNTIASSGANAPAWIEYLSKILP